MKVAHFISSPASGGVEVFVKDLSISLVNDGVEVVIIFLSNAKDIGRDELFEDEYLNDLEAGGVDYFFIGNECRVNIIKGMYRLNKIIKEKSIGVLHSHMPYGVLFSLFKAVPLIYTHHSVEARLKKVTFSIFNLYIDKYVGISDVCSDSLRRATGRNVVTIRNSVDIKRFSGLTRVRKAKDKYSILMVGRITQQKDYLTMVEAISQLPINSLNKVVVKIAGEGDLSYKTKITSLINDKGLNDKVIFLGNVNDIPELMDSADIFLMTSRWEGLPIALIESIVSGLPSIVTRVGGCEEIVSQYHCGLSTEAGDPEGISLAINTLINDEQLLNELSKNAISNAKEFDVKVNNAKHVNLYSSIIR